MKKLDILLAAVVFLSVAFIAFGPLIMVKLSIEQSFRFLVIKMTVVVLMFLIFAIAAAAEHYDQ